jgi:hypothetical protein
MSRTAFVVTAVLLVAPVAVADEMQIPKVYQGSPMQKGSWRMELLEMTGMPGQPAPAGTAVTLCLDSVTEMAKRQDKAKSTRDPACSNKLLKDTTAEAILETHCGESITRSQVTLDGDQSFLVSVEQSGPQGASRMKARYSYQGECKSGAGMISTDRNSPQCRQALAQVEGMDPAKLCGNAGAQRQLCEQKVAEARAQLDAMCL